VQEKSGAEAPHLLRLNQDIVAWSQKQKCGLKYVIYTFGKKVGGFTPYRFELE
jgi:hypothetical protein